MTALPSEYAAILNELNRDVLRARPSDPTQFCANWFNARLEQQRRAAQTTRLNNPTTSDVQMAAPNEAPPTGPFAISNPFAASAASTQPMAFTAEADESDDGTHFTPPPAFSLAGRRTSVSAESLVPGSAALDEIKNSVKTVIPKSDEQMVRISKATEGNLLFRHLEEDQYRDVLLAMKEVQVDAGTAVIEQGAQGDYFYVVESGTLDVYIRPTSSGASGTESRSGSIASSSTDDGPRTDTTSHLGEKKTSYGPSSSFGELALLYAQPRAATVLSTSPCILWALDRVTFRSILMETNNRRREMYESFIKEVPLFEHLSASERAKISDALELRTFEIGQEIVKQGERGTEFYVIVEGEAEVRKKTLERAEEAVGRLGKGDYFGELALLNKAPRAATIVAAEPRTEGAPRRLRVAALSESAFTRLLGPLTGIMGRHAREHYGQAGFVTSEGSLQQSIPPVGEYGFGEIAPNNRVGGIGADAGASPTSGAGLAAPSGADAAAGTLGGGTWVGGMGSSPFDRAPASSSGAA